MTSGVDIYSVHAVKQSPLRTVADIAHDFERTLLQLRVHLDELVQAVAGIAAGTTGGSAVAMTPALKLPSKARPPRAKRPPAAQHLYRGEQRTVSELAALAGCSYVVMHARLKNNSPEQAVAMGKSDRVANLHRGGQTSKAALQSGAAGDEVRRSNERFYDFMGRRCTVQELANFAGCTYAAMYGRLKQLSPADAVAMGKLHAKREPRAVRPATRTTEPQPPAPAPAPRPSVFEHRAPPPAVPLQTSTRVSPPRIDDFRADTIAAGSKLDQLQRGDLQASDAEPVIPPDVKRTVAPTPPDRFAVSGLERPFSSRRIGEYDDDRTHLARVYGGKG